MSADAADDEQRLDLSPERATLLRGALNVGLELLDRDFDPYELGLPLRAADRDVIDGVNDRLRERIEQRPDRGAAADTVRLTLAPAEVQATHDVLTTLRSLIANDAGREVLARVGYIVEPGSPVVQADRDHIDALLDALEPPANQSGLSDEELRDMTRAEFRERQHDRDVDAESRAASGFPTETIDPTKDLDRLIADARHDILHRTINHPGNEQLVFIAEDIEDTPSPDGCDAEFKNLIELVLLAAGEVERVPKDEWHVALNHLHSAHTAVLERLVNRECIAAHQEPDLLSQAFGDVERVLDRSAPAREMADRADEYLGLLERVASGAGHGRAAELGPQVERLVDDARERVADVYQGAGHANLSQVTRRALEERRTLSEARPTCFDIAEVLAGLAILAARADRAAPMVDDEFSQALEAIRGGRDAALDLAVDRGCVPERDAEGIERALQVALEEAGESDTAIAHETLRDYLTLVEEAFQP